MQCKEKSKLPTQTSVEVSTLTFVPTTQYNTILQQQPPAQKQPWTRNALNLPYSKSPLKLILYSFSSFIAILRKKFFYNITYAVKTLLNAENDDRAILCGVHLDNRKQIQQFVAQMIWLTYRENMKLKQVNSDVGWGCMVRVGQMMLAHTFRRMLKLDRNHDSSLMTNILTGTPHRIYYSFIDDDEDRKSMGNYSIQKIIKISREFYDMQTGEWFSPSSISYCLNYLHDKNPLRGFEKLNIYIADNVILTDDLNIKLQNKNRPLLIIGLCLIGIRTAEPKKLEGLKQLMALRQFNGLLGGIPRKAYYILGKTEGSGNFVYLDPHYVQEGTSRKNMDRAEFSCSRLLSIRPEQLHPSVGICFFCENISSLYELLNQIDNLRNNKQIQIPIGLSKSLYHAYDSSWGEAQGVREVSKITNREEKMIQSFSDVSVYKVPKIYSEDSIVIAELPAQSEPQEGKSQEERLLESIYQIIK